MGIFSETCAFRDVFRDRFIAVSKRALSSAQKEPEE
jgi:hypothetical protein